MSDLVLDALTASHLLAAAAVTLHALLQKRDVRAAIGWIGLAWLSPYAGSVLYYLFGINRVTRRAARLAPGVTPRPAEAGGEPGAGRITDLGENIATLARIGTRVTGRALAAGNSLSVLHNGDQAYPGMLEAIRGARRSVALASYIFRGDDVGRSFVDALGEARDRGLEVRVLIDGIGSGYVYSPAFRLLAGRGIAAARFMHDWLPWRMPFVNMRSHRKILVIDGKSGFTGGMNISASNVLASDPRHPVADMHFRVDGPIVRQLMTAFAEDWNFTTGEVLDGDCWWPPIPPSGGVRARGVTSGPDEDLGKLEAILAGAIGEARRSLRIVTPYFLPDQRLMQDIALAALRGVAVDIILPERSDHLYFDWALRSHLDQFVGLDLQVHLSPPPFDHTKLFTIDGRWCLVGSANWDVRSLRLNFEFGVECYDAGLVAEIDQVIDARIAAATPLALADLAQRALPVRLRDAATRLLLPYL